MEKKTVQKIQEQASEHSFQQGTLIALKLRQGLLTLGLFDLVITQHGDAFEIRVVYIIGNVLAIKAGTVE